MSGTSLAIGLLGAGIGAVAAILGQLVAHRLTRGRQLEGEVRELAALLISQLRMLQSLITNARAPWDDEGGSDPRMSRVVDSTRFDDVWIPYESSRLRLLWTLQALGLSSEKFLLTDATNKLSEFINYWERLTVGEFAKMSTELTRRIDDFRINIESWVERQYRAPWPVRLVRRLRSRNPDRG